MKIRKAIKKDLGRIAELFLEYDKYENNFDKDVELCSLNEVRKAEEEHINLGTKYLLAEEDGKIVGALNFDIDKRGKEKIGVLHTLIITKEARGKGFGSKLVNYALSHFKLNKCKRVKTFIHLKNKNAYEFWKKQGFKTEAGYSASRRL